MHRSTNTSIILNAIDAKSIQFLLSDHKALKYLFRYMGVMRRFKTKFGEHAPPQKETRPKKKKPWSGQGMTAPVKGLTMNWGTERRDAK